MKQIISTAIAGTLLATSLSVFAEEHRGRDRHFEGREIHRFGEHDLKVWRGGRWHHGRHEGRFGWWWIAAGIWYFYPAPAYPYPDPYIPPVTIINRSPPVIVQQVPAPTPVQPLSPPPVQSWYYCGSAKGYYPYVPDCPEAWRSVPAQPPQPAPR